MVFFRVLVPNGTQKGTEGTKDRRMKTLGTGVSPHTRTFGKLKYREHINLERSHWRDKSQVHEFGTDWNDHEI